MTRKRVLLLAMADSAHVARWLEVNRNLPYEITLVSTSPSRRIHPKIIELKHQTSGLTLRLPWALNHLALLLWVADRPMFFANKIRGRLVAEIMRKKSFDLVHAMESQNGGYLLSEVFQKIPNSRRPPVMLTLFGSDLFWFQRFEKHRQNLRELLANTTFLGTECTRDQSLSRQLGFQGRFLPLAPAGGYWQENDKSSRDVLPPRERQTILIKGYQNKWGKGSTSLKALEGVGYQLANFKLVVYSAEGIVPFLARRTARRLGMKVRVFRKHALSALEMQDLMAETRVHIGISTSDGLPAAVVEAAAMGAYIIQSDTSCTADWFNQEFWSSVHVDDVEQISRAIGKALENIDLLESAQKANLRTVATSFINRSEYPQRLYDYKTVLSLSPNQDL